MDESDWMSGIPQYVRLAIFIILVIVGLLVIACYFLYINNLSALLKGVRRENRKMIPWRVWLLLSGFVSFFIELMGYSVGGDGTLFFSITEMVFLFFPVFWQLLITLKISNSIVAEFRSRGLAATSRPTLLIGLFYTISCFFFIVGGLLPSSPLLDKLMVFVILLIFISWIVYWAETAKYKKQLRALPAQVDTDSQVFRNII